MFTVMAVSAVASQMESVSYSFLQTCLFQAELWEKWERRRKDKMDIKDMRCLQHGLSRNVPSAVNTKKVLLQFKQLLKLVSLTNQNELRKLIVN